MSAREDPTGTPTNCTGDATERIVETKFAPPKLWTQEGDGSTPSWNSTRSWPADAARPSKSQGLRRAKDAAARSEGPGRTQGSGPRLERWVKGDVPLANGKALLTHLTLTDNPAA